MEGRMVFDDANNITAFLHNDRLTPPSPQWISNSSHEDQKNNAAREESFLAQFEEEEAYEKRPPEKKRRLTPDQVEYLERCFEEENKLEPERKMRLANELNLQARQVAIWFQNRRARFKTKQLEKDYDVLKSSYDSLKLDFEGLHKINHKLKLQVQLLVEKLHKKKENVNKSDDTSQKWSTTSKTVICKQEYTNSISGKSDVLDSDSPNFADGNQSSFLEPADSSNIFKNQSSFSQDEDDNLSNNILRYPKIEYESYIDSSEDSLGCPIEEQSFWLWP